MVSEKNLRGKGQRKLPFPGTLIFDGRIIGAIENMLVPCELFYAQNSSLRAHGMLSFQGHFGTYHFIFDGRSIGAVENMFVRCELFWP